MFKHSYISESVEDSGKKRRNCDPLSSNYRDIKYSKNRSKQHYLTNKVRYDKYEPSHNNQETALNRINQYWQQFYNEICSRL